MDSIKRLQIFEKFLDKMVNYNWSTNDGKYFNYENDDLIFSLSSYSLSVTYKNPKDDEEQTGYQFEIGYSDRLKLIYSEMCAKAMSNALNKIADSEPDIKRELGIQDLLDE